MYKSCKNKNWNPCNKLLEPGVKRIEILSVVLQMGYPNNNPNLFTSWIYSRVMYHNLFKFIMTIKVTNVLDPLTIYSFVGVKF